MSPRSFALGWVSVARLAAAPLIAPPELPPALVASRAPLVLVRVDRLALDAAGDVVHRWYRLLRTGADGDVAGLPRLPFSLGADEVRVLRARVESPGAPPRELAWRLDGSTPRRLVFDSGGLPPGALVEVLLERRNHSVLGGRDLAGGHAFGDDVAVVRDVFEVSYPRGNPPVHLTRGLGARCEPTRETSGGQELLRWEVTEPPKGRPLIRRPNVRVTMLRSWREASDWYRPRWLPLLEPDEAVIAQARALTAGAATPQERAGRLVAFVVQDLPYRHAFDGTAADLVGAAAPSVLARRGGNCADKTNLLVALLRAVGIAAGPVLASQDPARPIDPEVPTFLPGDHALVRADLGGTAVFLDPTQPGYALGELPRELRRVLVWDPLTSEFLVTPTGSDTFTRRSELSVDPRGLLGGQVTLRATGALAARLRGLARRPVGATALARLLPPGLEVTSGPTARSPAFSTDLSGEPFEGVFSVRGELPRHRGALQVPTFLPSNVGAAEFAVSLEDEVVLVLPAGYQVGPLPAPATVHGPDGSFEALWRSAAGKLSFRARWDAEAVATEGAAGRRRAQLVGEVVTLGPGFRTQP